MQSELLLAVLAGLGGMFGWGFADFFAKKTIDKIGDVTTLFWGQLLGMLPLFILFFFNPTIPTLSNLSWLYVLVLGVWSGLSYIPTYIAFGKGKVSLLSPIFATYAVVVAILSAVFFDEIIPYSRQAAFLVVFIGVLLINGNPRDIWLLVTGKKSREDGIKGLPEILLAVCLYSLWLIAFDQFIGGMSWVLILLVIRIFSSLALYFYARSTNRKIAFADKSIWKYVILIGVFDVAAFAFVAYGFSATPYVSIVAMLSGAFSVPTMILGRVFLKEQATILQTIGSLVVIAGIMLVALL
jgi:drug/metabolite transporter (DMT)-like permease